ncbi:MAG: hypothetical protein ABEJ65_04895 [bacterium]
MSLIKEALDKAQEEKPEESPEEATVKTIPDSGTPEEPTSNHSQTSTSQLIIWSVVIVILGVLVGGQVVLLISLFVM